MLQHVSTSTIFAHVYTAPKPKRQPNFVKKQFRMFAISLSKFHILFAIVSKISPMLLMFSEISENECICEYIQYNILINEKIKNLLDCIRLLNFLRFRDAICLFHRMRPKRIIAFSEDGFRIVKQKSKVVS